MTEDTLFSFVHSFNKAGIISDTTIENGLNKLPQEDVQLFMLLVNYKNSGEFHKKIESGEI